MSSNNNFIFFKGRVAHFEVKPITKNSPFGRFLRINILDSHNELDRDPEKARNQTIRIKKMIRPFEIKSFFFNLKESAEGAMFNCAIRVNDYDICHNCRTSLNIELVDAN